MIRLGLCCIFRDQPIKFANTTATATGRMSRVEATAKLNRLCQQNAQALLAALRFCADNGIGCFRVNSQILPLKTHPNLGYRIDNLPDGQQIVGLFAHAASLLVTSACGPVFTRTSLLSSTPHCAKVVEASIRELEYQAEVAEWIGADVINIHAGGAYGDKRTALDRA